MNQAHPPKHQEISAGFFVPLSVQEERDLREFLKASDYSEPPKGLKELVLDCLYAEEDEREPNPILEHLIQNPDIVSKAASKVGRFLFGDKKTPRR